MKVVDYDYIVEVSTADALKQAASDVSSGYNGEIPGVNTFKINAETSIYNEQGGGSGIAGWSTDVKWTPHNGSISWSSGSISLPDGTSISISSGSQSISSSTYLYVDTTDGTVHATTHSYEAVGENKIMICAAFPNSGKNVSFKAFGCADQSSLTTGSNIANNTIVANNIASGTITANEIASGTITANEIASNTITASEIASGAITSSKIESGAVTASKIDVNELSAITSYIGDLYVGNDSGSKIRIYPYTSSQGRVQFYYEGDSVGYMSGQYISGVGDTIGIVGTNVAVDGKLWCIGKLRIPVGTDLY